MLLLIQATAEPVPTSAEQLVVLLGFALWTVAYVLFILKGFKDRTYGVPLFAVCLNVTWELYFAVLCPWSGEHTKGLCTSSGMLRWALILWLVLDLVILWQLLQFGWRQPWLQRHLPGGAKRPVFYVMVAVLLSLALAWQYTFVNLLTDQDGNSLAWLTNLFMSAGFAYCAVRRPSLSGLSYAGGWAMLAGNLAFAGYGILNHFAEFTAWPQSVTVALMFAVIMLNLFYLFVLWHRARVPKPEVASQKVPRPVTS